MYYNSDSAFSRVIGRHINFENERKIRAMEFEEVYSSESFAVHVNEGRYLLGWGTA
jgi:hypothetical protein